MASPIGVSSLGTGSEIAEDNSGSSCRRTPAGRSLASARGRSADRQDAGAEPRRPRNACRATHPTLMSDLDVCRRELDLDGRAGWQWRGVGVGVGLDPTLASTWPKLTSIRSKPSLRIGSRRWRSTTNASPMVCWRPSMMRPTSSSPGAGSIMVFSSSRSRATGTGTR